MPVYVIASPRRQEPGQRLFFCSSIPEQGQGRCLGLIRQKPFGNMKEGEPLQVERRSV